MTFRGGRKYRQKAILFFNRKRPVNVPMVGCERSMRKLPPTVLLYDNKRRKHRNLSFPRHTRHRDYIKVSCQSFPQLDEDPGAPFCRARLTHLVALAREVLTAAVPPPRDPSKICRGRGWSGVASPCDNTRSGGEGKHVQYYVTREHIFCV